MKEYYNTSLKALNTFGIDVQAARMVVLEPCDEVPAIAPPCLVLGAGSDVIFTGHYKGTILCLSDVPDVVHLPQCLLSVWGGMRMDDLVAYSLGHRLYGLENLSAIPGTVGASVVQNVGAYGVEAKDVVERVDAFDLEERRVVTFTAAQCRFAYRTSLFKEQAGRWLVLRVVYRLTDTFVPNLSYKALEGMPHATAFELRKAISDLRWQKLPRPEEHGSAGSFFKNPVVDKATCQRIKAEYPDMPEAHATAEGYKLSAGWLIDCAGWKGRTMGRAGVWPKNALVLYNTGGCTGTEVLALAEAIRHDVQQRFGIALDPEAIIV